MLSPSLALAISVICILVLLRLRVHPGPAIFAGSLVVSLLVLPLRSIPPMMGTTFINIDTVRLLVVVPSALTISSLMEVRGMLSKLATSMESIGPKLAVHVVPAVIGLVPMPAGALVSATAGRDLTKKVALNPEQSTFINYWFRHIWEFSIPVYPAIVAASAILSVSLVSVVRILAPMTLMSILAGAGMSYWILRKASGTRARLTGGVAWEFVKASWPILILVPVILLGVEAMIAFPVILALLIVQQRARWPELKKAFRYGLSPSILFLVYAIMLYKAAIDTSDAANVLVSDMQAVGLPDLLMLVVLPMLVGLATGYSPAFVGIALTLLVPFIVVGQEINAAALLLAYVSGMMGVLLSPLHLCLILSAGYFRASLTGVYKYIIPLTAVMESVALIIYFIAA